MAEAGISNKQALIYLAITFACFAALYPSLFHPLVRGIMKWEKTESDVKNEPPVPEQVKRSQAERRPGRPPLRGGVPPSPQSDQPQGATGQTHSSGKGGMMGYVLPVYAVGIVVYLIYVVSKVYGGGGKKAKKFEETDVYETLQKRLSAIDFERVLRGDDRAAMDELTVLADQLKQYRHEADGSDFDKRPTGLHAESNSQRQQRPRDINAAADLDVATDEYSLDDLLNQTDQLRDLSSAETQKLQKKLLEAEAKMALIADALRKATVRTEQVLSSSEDVAVSGQDLASQGGKTAPSAEDGLPLPDSGVIRIDDDNIDSNSDSHDSTGQVETLTADLDATNSSNNGDSAQTTTGVRRRAATKNAELDSND